MPRDNRRGLADPHLVRRFLQSAHMDGFFASRLERSFPIAGAVWRSPGGEEWEGWRRSKSSRPAEAGAPVCRRVPCRREKNREYLVFRPFRGETVRQSPMIPGESRQIPYAAEQGLISAEQGIEIPCSGKCRDNSRVKHRPGSIRSRVKSRLAKRSEEENPQGSGDWSDGLI
jgi:hypothetical protein